MIYSSYLVYNQIRFVLCSLNGNRPYEDVKKMMIIHKIGVDLGGGRSRPEGVS